MYHLSLSCSGVQAIATLRWLLTDVWRELRYFSYRKSHPSGVRVPIINTAMVVSTGRLEAEKLDTLNLLFLLKMIIYIFQEDEHWPHVAVRVPPLVEELGGFGHTGAVVPDAAEQQQVAPQHSLRHCSRVSPLLLVNQPPKQSYNVGLKNTSGQR